jgi:hypothetical protein
METSGQENGFVEDFIDPTRNSYLRGGEQSYACDRVEEKTQSKVVNFLCGVVDRTHPFIY